MTDPELLLSHPSVAALAAALRAVLTAGGEPPEALRAVPRCESDGVYSVELRAPRGTGRHRLTAVRHGRSLDEACARSWESVVAHLEADVASAARDLRTFGAGSVDPDRAPRVGAMLSAAQRQPAPGAGADRRTTPPPLLAPGGASAAAETVRCPGPDRARVAAAATLKRMAAEAEERAARAVLDDEEAWRAARLLADEGCLHCGRRTEGDSRACGTCDAKESGR